jgi:hypothetical protein
LAGAAGTIAGKGDGSVTGSTTVALAARTAATGAAEVDAALVVTDPLETSGGAGPSELGASTGGAGGGLLIELDEDPRDEAEPRSGAGTDPFNVVRLGRGVDTRGAVRTAPLPFADGPFADGPFADGPLLPPAATSSVAGVTDSTSGTTVPPAGFVGLTTPSVGSALPGNRARFSTSGADQVTAGGPGRHHRVADAHRHDDIATRA